ncbi:MAG TPA: cation diffusion facilitator family transporter [Nevskiaceae bacterium]|nr:cation diffusion facilitator family transporter [Nevskiaceae bacterium]
MTNTGSPTVAPQRAASVEHERGHAHPHGYPHDRAHGHGHEHAHGGHGGLHVHGTASPRRLVLALAILGGFTVIEALGGWYAHSVALLAEAIHMLADSAALLLAIAAIRASRRPATLRRTYGSSRFQTLTAYTNGLLLIALTLFVVVEAVRRLLAPAQVDGEVMLIVAILGGLANLSAFVVLSGAHSLNERGARAHVLSDLLGSAAAVVAALVILLSGWVTADPILSILVSILILRSGWNLTREAGHVLLEGTPRSFDPARLSDGVAALPGVLGVHHVHVWSLTGDAPVVSLHVTAVAEDSDSVLQRVHDYLEDEFDVEHATVQIERGPCVDPGGECHQSPDAGHLDPPP